MSKLNGQQFEQLQQALESAFPDYDDLARMVRIKLEKDLEHIVKRDALSKVVFQLIKTAEAQGWLTELVEAARKANPNNPDLKPFASSFLQPKAEERPAEAVTVTQLTNSNTPGLEPSANTSLPPASLVSQGGARDNELRVCQHTPGNNSWHALGPASDR